MKTFTLTVVVGLTFTCATFGQAPAPPPEPPPAPTANGDVIKLKSGAVLEGVQVLRRTPAAYVVELLKDINLEIPSSQVVSVDYDNVDPARQRRREGFTGGQERVVAGRKIASELYGKLTAPISDSPLKYNNENIVTIFEDLGKLTGAAIVVTDLVRNLPEQERQWSLDKDAGTTLISLLEDFRKDFQNMEVVYEYDVVLITAKATEEEQTP